MRAFGFPAPLTDEEVEQTCGAVQRAVAPATLQAVGCEGVEAPVPLRLALVAVVLTPEGTRRLRGTGGPHGFAVEREDDAFARSSWRCGACGEPAQRAWVDGVQAETDDLAFDVSIALAERLQAAIEDEDLGAVHAVLPGLAPAWDAGAGEARCSRHHGG